jgi:hypothetical protein
VTSTETERTDGQSGGNAAAEQENGHSDSGARKALKIGALAAAAGTAAYAASRAMTSSGSQSDDEGSENGGGSGGRGGRTTIDQIASAIGNSRWDMVRDMVVPFAESGARSAGAYVAKDTPDFLSDTLVPKFIEGFVEAKGKKVTSSD